MADSEFLDSSESFASSDSISGLSAPNLDDAIVDDAAGQTASPTDEVAVKEKSGGLFSDFNIFTAMLATSLILILLATFLLIIELGDYGGMFGSPWRTGSVGR